MLDGTVIIVIVPLLSPRTWRPCHVVANPLMFPLVNKKNNINRQRWTLQTHAWIVHVAVRNELRRAYLKIYGGPTDFAALCVLVSRWWSSPFLCMQMSQTTKNKPSNSLPLKPEVEVSCKRRNHNNNVQVLNTCSILRRHLGFFLVPGFTQCLEVGGAWVKEIWILELGKFCLWNPES